MADSRATLDITAMATVIVRPDQPRPLLGQHEIGAAVDGLLNRHACVGLAVGVVRDGRLEYFRGHGLADVASATPITEDTVFRIGSITKTFTAIAVMQLWEQGRIDLDAPANDYLRAYRLVPTKQAFRPATVRHLLTHTAGIPEVRRPLDVARRLFGETVPAGRPSPTLADYYRGGLPVCAEPGSRFIYTDHGFATLGQIVEDVSGVPLDRHIREHLFEPLGMGRTDLVRAERIGAYLATGYDLRSDGPRAVPDYEVIAAGAGGAYSTPRDMARYLAALMGGGANQYGRVLQPATLASMFKPQYQPHPAIPGIGAAFYRVMFGNYLAVEHGGIVPGFTSEIYVAPDEGVGIVAFTNGASQAMFWMPGEVAGLLGQALGAPNHVIRSDLAQHPEIWGQICGWYPLEARLTDARARLAIGAGAEVSVRRGRLTLRIFSPFPAMSRRFVLHPDDEIDPAVFRIDLSELGAGTARVAFSGRPGDRKTVLHLDFGKPLSMHRRASVTNPSWLARRAIPALLVAGMSVAIFSRCRRSKGRQRRLRGGERAN
jgi:CubicO group peptidase (beta-lactamase class C family)